MTIPDLKQARLLKKHSRDTPGRGYTIYNRVYDIGRLSLSDVGLEPRDGLPEDSTIIITTSRIGKVPGEAEERAIVTAAKGSFKTVTISSTITQALQVVTLVTGGPFYPQMVGTLITITGETNVTVTAYTSPSSVTVDVSQNIAGATVATFPNATTELAISRDYQGSKGSFWWSEKNFLEDKADAAALVADLWDSYFVFNSHFPRGYAQRIRVLDEDPFVLTKSRITVEYRTAYNPKQYPIGIATQEMYTTGDTKKLLYDLSKKDGTCTQALKVVTWVSGDKFRPANVGADITITGAGTPTTQITGYTDATHVTVVVSQAVGAAAVFAIPARPIETKPDKDGYYYVVETGTNIVPDPHAIFVIRTALARTGGSLPIDYLDLAQFAGKGNDAAFSKIGGGIPKNQALCMKVGVAPDYIDDGSDAYVPVMYIFAYYDETLDNWCTAMRMRNKVKKEAVLHRTDDPESQSRIYELPAGNTTDDPTLAKTRTVNKPEPAEADDDGADKENKIRDAILYANFAAIDNLVTWGP